MYSSVMDFYIMNGAGNRFAIFDARGVLGFQVSREIVINFCAQNSTEMGEKGADQLIIIRDPKSKKSKVFMEIWNQKGFEVNACGNATRCVAWIYMQEAGCSSMVLETKAGLLCCKLDSNNKVTVDMGKPELEWKKIPLAKEMNTEALKIKFNLDNYKIIGSPSAVNMGNPHCIFFIKDFSDIDYKKIGARIEIHTIFPEQANIGFVKVINENQIQLKVWERGVGMTLACGTGACAAVVAAVRQKRVKNKVRVQVDGGELFIDWEKNSQHVFMTGPVELEHKKVLKNYF